MKWRFNILLFLLWLGSDDLLATEKDTVFDFDADTIEFLGHDGVEDVMAKKGLKWSPELLFEIVTDRSVDWLEADLLYWVAK